MNSQKNTRCLFCSS